jgi:hypothetical protein
MKKLLGLFICGCVAMVLSLGSAGCTKDKGTADKKNPPPPADKAVSDKKEVDKKVPEVDKKPVDKKVVPEVDKKVPEVDKKVVPETDKKVVPETDKKVVPETDKKPADKKVVPEKAAKVEVKIKSVEEVSLKKKGDTKVKIELTEAAPEDLKIKAWAKDVDAKVLTGEGTIKKGETSGEVTITANEVPATVSEITVDIAATEKSKAATTTIKTKVK